ncbi:CPBP family intramembrane glutamic endopeptidase [Sediminispirochaeta bajacaliforniensis]|uniref:CPBP family intramembrane glutamic endopeptidase n=1 Tax=Sediminispirochaeta bajacaliforniensis TaxID=148 RepID=UPI000368ED5A|nr:type II CAAX endopeptidase family protein [Sediminispirochaeta bajacaliforniensis]
MTIFPEERNEKSGNDPKSLLEPILLFFVLFFPGYLSGTDSGQKIDFANLGFLFRYAAVALPQILLLLFMISKKGPGWPERYGITRIKRRDIPGALLLLPLLLAISFLIALLFPFGLQESWGMEKRTLLLPAIVAMVITGYREELFFRAYLLRELSTFLGGEEQRPGWREVTTSSLLFAAGHLYQGWGGALTTLLIAMVLGFRYSRKKSLHEVAIAHSLYNSVALIMISFGSY